MLIQSCQWHSIIRPRKLTWLMGKIGIRSWIGESCQVKVSYIDSVRDWKGMLQQAPVTFSGGLKEDSSGLRCFLAMRRQGVVGTDGMVTLRNVTGFDSDLISSMQ